MTPHRDRATLFAGIGLGLAALGFVIAVAGAFGAFGSDSSTAGGGNGTDVEDDGAVADRDADPVEVATASATAMAAVTSVEFDVTRDGAPVFVDSVESTALDALHGQFVVPGKAQATLEVTIDGNLATRIGAVAVDDEIWITEPITGDFEPLPAGYDIDPARFFDPVNGWQPLLANLEGVTMVEIDDRGGERYHIRGTAPAAQVSEITVGLVDDQDVEVDLWIHPGSMLVTALEFTTTAADGDSDWVLELGRYGETFVIERPANIRGSDDSGAMSA